MEARQTFKGDIAPKGLMVVVAVCATVAAAAAAATISNNLNASSASVKGTVHAAPGSVLRQDNPVQAGPALIDRGAERASTVNAAPGSILRQDNPVLAGPIGSTGMQNGSRDGVLEDFGFTAGGFSVDEHGPDSDLTRVLPTAPAAYDPGWDARSVREGHGA
jgi:hypothetical protein